MSGAGCKRKGSGFERDVVKELMAAGIFAEKVPLSGAVKGGSFESDIQALIQGRRKKIECKIRRRAWSDLYQWLAGNDILCIRRSGSYPLVVMSLGQLIEFVKEEI